ncbi:uncharacterized protein DUF4905 [Mucilaginibacter yixingensis]|uniref:Uncharacterized protein DUF4905 n=1 Tax=Mucilaginibacter yixingensis TaxID=1295612 RepID=A0A2T5JAW4_9SPHI|nr:DUF4905 domain-containing protein [Mucilaginibacter yixingensis]PTQ97995.1 uncharacterized protein DUF4905 [Mucilaginibacter yixingensis]
MTHLQPVFSRQFNGVVWRMEIDPISHTLFIELRNETDKQVSFASIDVAAGRLNFEGLTTDERWLTGMEGAYNGVLLLHHYESNASPTHKALIAIDGKTGEQLWANYNWMFDHFTVNGAVVSDARLQPRKLMLANLQTGELLRPYDPQLDTEPDTQIGLPDIVLPEGELPIQPYGNMMHRLLYNSYRIVSLHALNTAGSLTQHLYVMMGSDVLYHDLLNADIQKLQPEAFVQYNNHLIYLKHRSALSIVNL